MKKALLVLIIAISLIGVGALTYAALNQTNTKSSASGCATPPKLIMESTDKYEAMTIYHLKLINNCDSAQKFAIDVVNFPNTPETHNDWTWKDPRVICCIKNNFFIRYR